jgi:hypothetical protein
MVYRFRYVSDPNPLGGLVVDGSQILQARTCQQRFTRAQIQQTKYYLLTIPRRIRYRQHPIPDRTCAQMMQYHMARHREHARVVRHRTDCARAVIGVPMASEIGVRLHCRESTRPPTRRCLLDIHFQLGHVRWSTGHTTTAGGMGASTSASTTTTTGQR